MRLVERGPAARVPAPLLGVLGDPEAQENRLQHTVIRGLQKGSTRSVSAMISGMGLSKVDRSPVNRIAKDAGDLLRAEFSERPLDGVSVAAVLLDGTPVGRLRVPGAARNAKPRYQTIVWALGITTDGTKVPLGMIEGPRENSELVGELLTNITQERHLDVRDALWVIDGGRGLRGIRNLSRNAVIQRCTVHKDRNIVGDNLKTKEREQIGGKLLGRLRAAWLEPDHTLAANKLQEASTWLREQGHDKAAESVLEGAEWTLTLQRLGISEPEIVTAVGTTNNIESVHQTISERKKRTKRWLDPPDMMRQRCVAAAVAYAEENWSKAVNDPAALERLSLAVMADRHPGVTLQLDNRMEDRSITVAGLALADGDQPAAYRALGDLRTWAMRNGKALDVPEHVIEQVPRPDRLRAWIARETHGRTSRHARARQRPANALAVAREGVDEGLAVPLAEAALRAAPDVVALGDRALKAEAAGLWAAQDGLRAAAGDVHTWWDANWRVAAREIALARERMRRGDREWSHPLAGGRAEILGAQRAQWLLGESAYQGARIENAAPTVLAAQEARIGSVLGGLDAPAAELERTGRAVAACRELDRRELLARVREQGPGKPAEHVPQAGSAPLERYRRPLGERRSALIEAHADALVPRLAGEETATLERLREELGAPWRTLTPASAMRTLGHEQRDQPAALAERQRALREMGHWERRAQTGSRHVRVAAEQQALRSRDDARRQWTTLRGIDEALAREREVEGSLDSFVAEHPEAALDHAIGAELERRRELEAPERVEQEALQRVAEPVPQEIGM